MSVNTLESTLENVSTDYFKSKTVEAMDYSLLAGGKRIRPTLFLEVLRAYNIDQSNYLDIACAIEMIHTYSLIHDDLPGMDNDDYRRGRLTCHKKYDEATAILAGDGLLNQAVLKISQSKIDATDKIALINCLFEASGVNGMIYGQDLDIQAENKTCTIEELKTIHHHKTGALISASFEMAAIIAAPQDALIWRQIGYDLGLAFQIQDDVLDVIGDSQVLGKPVGSDAINHKSTYVTILGIEEANKEVLRLFNTVEQAILALQIDSTNILKIVSKIKERVM